MNKTMIRLLVLSLLVLLHQKAWSQTSHTVQGIELTQELLEVSPKGAQTVKIKASGGSKFRWNTGATTQFIEVPLHSKDRYSVEVEESDGRRSSISTSVASSFLLKSKKVPSKNNQLAPDPGTGCPNSSLGGYYSRICAGTTLTLSAGGGTSYLWSNGATSPTITVSPTANIEYTVTITYTDPEDANYNCQDVKTTGLIEVIPQPTASIAGGNLNFCGFGTATLTASAGSGITGASYLWSTGHTTSTISVAASTTTSLGVTVSTGSGLCSSNASTTIGVTPFSPAVNGSNNICLGTGTLLTASGGSSYQWSNGSNNNTLLASPTSVGTHVYTVTITAGTCSAVRSHSLIVTPPPTASILGPNKACCNGSVTLSASGTGSYQWSTGATTSSISPSLLQSSQSYGLTITDPTTQCTSVDDHVVNVLERPTLNDIPNSICAGGSVTLSVNGGSSYSWNVGGTTASIVHSPSSFTEYRVTVTDANGCVYILSKTVNVNTPPNITFGGGTSICAGQSLNVTAFGGQSYLWSHNNATTASITVSPTQNTTYTVAATSSGGCVASAQRAITVKPSPNGNITGAGSICPGQSVTLTASGGSSYSWSGGASTASITVSPTQNTNYTVSITNPEGCTVVKSHAIAVNISGTASNDGLLTCSKSSAILSGQSGAQGATYTWKDASGAVIATTANTSVNQPGVYSLEIRGIGGCTYNTSTEVLADRSLPTLTLSNNGPLTCTQTSVTLIGSSNVAGTYEWRDASGTLIGNSLNASVTQAGTYTLKVTGNNGCSQTASTVAVADLAAPVFSASSDGPLTCNKSSVTLSASSSTQGLQYVWKNGSGGTIATSATVTVSVTGSYTVEARGSNGCKQTAITAVGLNAVLPQVTASNTGPISCTNTQTNLQGSSSTPGVRFEWYNPNNRLIATQANVSTKIPGLYTLKVIAPDGCANTATSTVSTSGAVPLAVSISNNGPISCTQNSAFLRANTLSTNVDYEWRSANGTLIGRAETRTVSVAGTYTLTVIKRSDGCALSTETIVRDERTATHGDILGDTVVCWGKPTTLHATGGGTYYWSTGRTSQSITINNVYEPTTYSVTISNGAYCKDTVSRTVRIAPNPVAKITGESSTCEGSPISLTASGGVTYQWSTAATATHAVLSVSPSTPTSYTVTVTSDEGCTATTTHSISIKALPNFTLNGKPSAPFCGSAQVNLSVTAGSNTNYTWLWSTGETGTNIQRQVDSTRYLKVTARRGNGCTRSDSAWVQIISKPKGQIGGMDIACAGQNTTWYAPLGSSYQWSTGANSSSLELLKPSGSQTYRVTVSNAANCSTEFVRTLIVPDSLKLSYTLAGTDDCVPNNASVLPSVRGGQGAIKIEIARNGQATFGPILNGLGSGSYTLLAKDQNNCEASRAVVIAEAPVSISQLSLQNHQDCIPGNTRVLLSTTGDRLPLKYRLNDTLVAGPSVVLPRGEREYTLEVEDAAGCKASRSEFFPEHDVVKAEIDPIDDCNEAPLGSIKLNVEGWNLSQLHSSVDSGQTWIPSNEITELAPGVYPILVRNTSNGCTLAAEAIEIEALECPSSIGFTKESILITSPDEIANLPLAVNYPGYFVESGQVTLRLLGDGFPHFFSGDGSRENADEPELRGEQGIDRPLSYPAGFVAPDLQAYPLSDSAGVYLFPAIYTFELKDVSGSKLKVDPERKTLRVLVRLGPPESADEQSISVCDPAQCPVLIGENYGNGFCYSWEGPIESTQVGQATISVCPSSETVYTQKILDINTLELVKINTYRIKVGGMKLAIVSSLNNRPLCAGEEATLSAYSLKDGKLLSQSSTLKFVWSNGETGNPIRVKPAKNKNYSVYVTEIKSGCVSKADYFVVVQPKPSVAIIPSNPTICKQGSTYLSTELKIAQPAAGITYTWSNGTIGNSTLINQPGTYTVTASSSVACTAVAQAVVEENTVQKSLSTVEGRFYKLPAQITPTGSNDPSGLEVGAGGMIENHTVYSDFLVAKPTGVGSVSLINSLENTMNLVLFNSVEDKKIIIVDKSAFCRKPSILAQAKAEIIKHQIGFVLFMDDTPGASIIHILGSNFKDRYTPVSGEHITFTDTRLKYLANKNELTNLGTSLSVALNSLVDNFTSTYVDMTTAIGSLTSSPGVVQPELRRDETPDCKYDLNAPTNFLSPAGVVITLETGATPFFRYKAEIADLAQSGALVSFNYNLQSRVGRYWPPIKSPVANNYYFIGYDNVTATPQNYWDIHTFPVAFGTDTLLKIWWANIAGVDATKLFELNYVNQKASVGLTGDGTFPPGGDVTTVKRGPVDTSIVKSSVALRTQVEKSQPPQLRPNQLTLWSIKMGKSYDRTDVLVERSGEPDLRDGYIVYIPKDPNEVDPTKGFYQVYVKFYNNRELPEYYYFDEFLCKWIPYEEISDEQIRRAFNRLPALKVLRALYDFAKTVDEAIFDGGHIFLDLAGLINPAFDLGNAVWYFSEGRTTDGVVSVIGAIPGFGDGTLIVKKVLVVSGAVTTFVLKFFLKNGDEVIAWTRSIKYTDEAGNVVEELISFDNLAEKLAASDLPVEDIGILLGKMNDPNFTGPEAARILKAFEADPDILIRNYELLANSPLLQTNLEVLFKFDQLIKGGVSRLKLQEALAGPFGDILNKAAEQGEVQLDNVFGILTSAFGKYNFSAEDFASLADDFVLNENLLAEMGTNPGLIDAWRVLSSSKLRTSIDDLKIVDEYLKQFPGDADAVKKAFESLKSNRKSAFLSGLKNASKEPLGIANARRATPTEIADAVNKLRDHRSAAGNTAGNFGYLEGTINGLPLQSKHEIWSSGKADLVNEPQIFTAIEAPGTSGSWLRNTDSEYKMLNDLAAKLKPGAKLGDKFPDVTGEIKIVSELPYCESCQGVIQQFRDMFPNIKVILIDGVK